MVSEAVSSPYLVPYQGGLAVSDLPTQPPADADGKKRNK